LFRIDIIGDFDARPARQGVFMAMDVSRISWQERYRAPEVYTLRCRIQDKPGMLGKLLAAIGQEKVNLGDVSVVGVDSSSKMRDVQVFCSNKKQLDGVVGAVNSVEGIEVLGVNDNVFDMHHRGAISMVSRVPIKSLTDLRMVYTPGVAFVCNEIVKNPESAWELTGLCDRVAIVTDGTAVLGLGNIGVVPSLPVMEGKAAIFAEFSGISAIPILVDSTKPDEIVETVCKIAPSFGAIQLEDISAPTCFEVEDKLKERLNIPVFHDDQHGTATVSLAAIINALKKTNRQAKDCTAIIVGAGAAGLAITKNLLKFGFKDIVVYDSVGPLYKGRTEKMNPYKQKIAEITNKNNVRGGLLEGFKGRDLFIGVAQPRMVSSEMISMMAKNALVFPLSNPVGEISVDEALAAGAAVAADGRTINNALAYPGLFRGALDVRAKQITIEMQIAVSKMLASLAPEGALLPDMLDKSVHQKVAEAAAGAYKEN
jgi:malate dehydrogenase (oxaloacetate-decarboxylating)